ncbi:MAG: pyridoxamine 5'-phosphate oxidase family protein [Thaumarchaeota archaeon]|nr:pyridoxamine 5'-phosphate oxidase family protein [Nitrososphaerota archaeon]
MISQDVREFVNKQKLGFVATISPDNTPSLSPKGSLISWDSENLAFADIRSLGTVNNISTNPNVEINVIDPILRKGYRFSGTASIIKNGKTFDDIIQYYDKNGIKSAIDIIILIKVTKVSEILSPSYDSDISEEEIKSMWKKHYLDS